MSLRNFVFLKCSVVIRQWKKFSGSDTVVVVVVVIIIIIIIIIIIDSDILQNDINRLIRVMNVRTKCQVSRG